MNPLACTWHCHGHHVSHSEHCSLRAPEEPKALHAFLERRITAMRESYPHPPANRTKRGLEREAKALQEIKEDIEQKHGLGPRLIETEDKR